MTNEELVIRIKAGIDVSDNMLQLYKQVKGFIKTIAKRYQSQEDIEDLMQEGYLALYDAIDGYDPDTGNKFLTYASWHFRQRIQRYIMEKGDCFRLPVHRHETLRQYRKVCNAYQVEHNRQPSDQELGYHLKISLERVQDIKDLAKTSTVRSLDSPITGIEGDEGGTVVDLVPDPEPMEDGVIDRVEQEQLKAVIWDCVDSLEGRLPNIIRKRYIDQKTLREVGEEYGISKDRIRAQEAQGLRELRKPKYSSRLKPFIDEIRSSAMYGVGPERFKRTWTSATEYTAMRLLEGRFRD